MRLAICDDSAQDLQTLTNLLRQYQSGHPGVSFVSVPFSSCTRLLEAVQTQPAFDAFILDVVMPGASGIAAAEQLRTVSAAPIVYVTSSAEYALDAWRVHALRYLTKPLRREELFEAVDAIFAACMRSEPPFSVKTAEGLRQLNVSDIISVQNILHNVEYTLCGKEEPVRSVTCRSPFLEIVAPLLALPQFEQTHKSYIINFDHVKYYQARGFVMRSDEEIPISPKYAAAVRKAYLSYFAGDSEL